MQSEEIGKWPTLNWMPSRIPVRDALSRAVPPEPGWHDERILSSGEQRYYPQTDGSLRVWVPYDGKTFDPAIYQIELKGWDHSTCDLCNTRIPAMTLCYVTKTGPYYWTMCKMLYKARREESQFSAQDKLAHQALSWDEPVA